MNKISSWIAGLLGLSDRGRQKMLEMEHAVEKARLQEQVAFERRLYRDALLHDCDYAYIINVNENSFYDVYKGSFLEQYYFDVRQPYNEVMERLYEKMEPVILSHETRFHSTSDFIGAYERGKRIVEVEYYIPSTDVYKKKSIFLSKNDDGVIFAFVVCHDITESRKKELETQAALIKLAETAKKVESGNLDVTFDRNAPGQIGLLADVLTHTVFHLRQYTNTLKRQTTQDPLTSVKNKRAWQDAEHELNEQIRNKTADFALIVCDINRLKQTNDSVGHGAGDSLIIRSCRHICSIFKHSPVYRIGGDEFAVILENTDLENCHRLLQEFELQMENQTVTGPEVPRFSIALGFSRYQPEDTTFSDVFHRADAAMYQKKMNMKTD